MQPDVLIFDETVKAMTPNPHEGKVKNMVEMMSCYNERLAKSELRRLDLSRWITSFKNCVRPLIPGDFMVIVADTGSGKTAVLQAIAYHAAPPLPTLFFEIELSDDLMCERMLSMHTKQPATAVEADIKARRMPDLDSSFDHLHFCTASSVALEDIDAIVRLQNSKMEHPIAVVIIDYIGLIRGEGKSRYERFSNVAEGLKVLAKSLDVVMVASCQVQRAGSDSGDPVGLHSCKDSGSIENSAGLLLGVWREGDTGREMKIKVLKNTRGVSGIKIDALFDGATMRISQDHGIHSTHRKIMEARKL